MEFEFRETVCLAHQESTAMTTYIALLRAVNVGGTGKLPMADLKKLCEEAGFEDVRTYIASGNVIFNSSKRTKQVKQALEERLESYAGKRVSVAVRTAEEFAAVLKANPFPEKELNRTVAIFLDDAPPADAVKKATGVANELVELGRHEIYVYYGEGMGTSKLKIPAAKEGTARNINTITKLVELSTK